MAAIKKGADAVSKMASSGANHFLKVEPDESVKIVPLVGLDDMISIQQHFLRPSGRPLSFPCVSEEEKCPGCAANNRPGYRGFLPVMVKEDGESKAKLFSFGIGMAKDIIALGEAIDDTIQGCVLNLKRTGSGKQTRWNLVNTGKKAKIDDVDIPFELEEEVGPATRETILTKMYTLGADMNGLWTDEEAEAIKADAPAPQTPEAKSDDDWE